MSTRDDWRLRDQEKYLFKKKLYRHLYVQKNGVQDHAHCDFCWATFSPYPGDEHEGYSTLDDQFWVCDSCFADFKDDFCWIVQVD